MDGLCPRNAGQCTRHMCKKDTQAVSPTWNVRLSPVSEDKGQDSTTRGGQGDGISSGFEPAKALVRGLPLPRPPSFQGQLVSYQSYNLSGESAQAGSRLWPSHGIQGVTSDKLVAEGESAGGEWGCASHLAPYDQHNQGLRSHGRACQCNAWCSFEARAGLTASMWCPWRSHHHEALLPSKGFAEATCVTVSHHFRLFKSP